jgi:hypothetical protein
MNNPNDLHYWSKHYREEAPGEAQRQSTHLSGRERAERGAGRGITVPSLRGALASLFGWARLAG